MQKTALLICFRKTAGRFLLKFDCYFGCLYSDTTSPGTDDLRSSRAEAETACGSRITGIPPLRGSLRAAPFGTGVPTLVLSSQDRSATICFLDGRTRFPPYLPHSCSFLHRWIFALPPMSLPILYLYKAHQRMYFSFWICTWQGSVQGFFCGPEKFPSLLIRVQIPP